MGSDLGVENTTPSVLCLQILLVFMICEMLSFGKDGNLFGTYDCRFTA